MSDSSEVKLEIEGTRLFTSWLNEQQVSLAFTTYQTGKLFLIGLQPDGQISIFERSFNRCMGLYATEDAQSLYMSSQYQLWRFEKVRDLPKDEQGYDALYIPQVGYTTGDIDVHDIALDENKQPIFVNTLFSCLATTDEAYNFKPVWKPSFISKLAAEDRCHLNGLAMENGQPRYVSSVSQSDSADGWRDKRIEGGVIIDVSNDEIIASGLSMPHSPRLYQGKLYCLNSGTGEFGFINMDKGCFEAICFCPGYLRGLTFIDHFAVVGLSLSRHNKTFDGLPLQETLSEKASDSRCGLQVIDLNSGDVVHGLRLSGIVEELYDVVALPGIKRPMALGFKTDEIRHVLNVG